MNKYEEALAWIETNYPLSSYERGMKLSPVLNTIRHALTNCLPELEGGWEYEKLHFIDTGNAEDAFWTCTIRKWGLAGRLTRIDADGNTPRQACEAAIKKIQGGGSETTN